MTNLKRAVRRRTIGLHRGRRIMVALVPGDMLALRMERCRQTEYVLLAAIYDYAVKARVLSERNQRRQTKAKPRAS